MERTGRWLTDSFCLLVEALHEPRGNVASYLPRRPPAGLPPYPTHGAVTGPPGWRSLGIPSPGVSAEATCRADLGLVPFGGENAPVRVVVTRIEQDGTMQHRLVELVRRAKPRSTA